MKTASIIALVLLACPLAASAHSLRNTQVIQPMEDLETRERVVAPLLGSCERFALHGHAGVAAAGDMTEIHGDVGGDNAISGFGPPPLPHVFAAGGYDYFSVTSESNSCAGDKQTAYDAAKGTICTHRNTPTDLGGLTLTPGVYCNSAGFFVLTAGALTLDAQGDDKAVFIFQAATTVRTSISTTMVLSGNALAKNVFWQAGAAINLAGYSTFRGNLLAYTAVTLGTSTVLEGRALASTASVTLAGANQISTP